MRKIVFGRVVGLFGGAVLTQTEPYLLPFGASLGFFLGFWVDKTVMFSPSLVNQKERLQKNSLDIIEILAKTAKADGSVSRVEVESFKRLVSHKKIEEGIVGDLFNEARRHTHGVIQAIGRLAELKTQDIQKLGSVLDALFCMSAADSHPSPAQEDIARVASEMWGIESSSFESAYWGRGTSTNQRRKTSGTKTGSKSHRQTRKEKVKNERKANPLQRDALGDGDPYKVLGVKESATPQEIKAAYRKLVRKYHPDKHRAEGKSEKEIKAAEEKLTVLNAAYEALKEKS